MKYLSRDQVRELDRRATVEFGIPSWFLMENAGRGSADLLASLYAAPRTVWILCGPGNNGGDGFVMARHLKNRGFDPRIAFRYDPRQLKGDAAASYLMAQKSNILIDNNFVHDSDAIYVDAWFGTGFSRPLENDDRLMVETLNSFNLPILSIDVPSGIDCNTGKPLGVCVRATHTATFVAPKLGFQNSKAKQFTGEVHVIDIGIPRALLAEYL